MILENLTTIAQARAARAQAAAIRRLAETPTPPGITAQAIDGGIALSGKALRRRYITDPDLRNFTR